MLILSLNFSLPIRNLFSTLGIASTISPSQELLKMISVRHTVEVHPVAPDILLVPIPRAQMPTC